MIDRNNPDITWFRPNNSKEWSEISTDELTDKLVKELRLVSPALSSPGIYEKRKDGSIHNNHIQTK